jgi:hypothetical protein
MNAIFSIVLTLVPSLRKLATLALVVSVWARRDARFVSLEER